MKVKLVRYHLNMGDAKQAKHYNEICAALKARGVKKWATHNFQHKGFPPEGSYEIDTAFVFENQYNTAVFENQYNTATTPDHSGYRIFEWSEVIWPNRLIKDGYYLADDEGFADLQEYKRHHYVCGYCGNRHQGDDAPITCNKCIGSEYLTEKDLPLLVMQPISGPKRDATIDVESYRAAQAQAKIDRAAAQKARLLKQRDRKVFNSLSLMFRGEDIGRFGGRGFGTSGKRLRRFKV